MKYTWREGFQHRDIDADVFGQVVEKLEATEGEVTVDRLLELAKSPTSPVHGVVDWNDATAAEYGRREQMRRALSALVIVRVKIAGGVTTSSRAFYSMRTPAGRRYKGTANILSDLVLRAQLIEQAHGELDRYITKYEHVVGMIKVVPTLKEAIAGIREQLDAIEAQAKSRKARRARGVPLQPGQTV